MPSEVPRNNATKKREQLTRREQELVHALRSGVSRERLVQVVEEVRAAQLSLLKAELYWTEDARVRGRDVGERISKSQTDSQRWIEWSVDEILHEYSI